jgi:hypothetical protein
MVEQIPVPDRARQLANLDRIDYADAFTAATSIRRTPEAWVRSVEESRPLLIAAVRRIHHRVLGLRLGPPGSPGHVFGWEILENRPDEAVLGVSGGLITPRMVGLITPGKVVLATLLRYEHPSARPVWAAIAPVHRTIARYLIGHTVRSALDPMHAGSENKGL